MVRALERKECTHEYERIRNPWPTSILVEIFKRSHRLLGTIADCGVYHLKEIDHRISNSSSIADVGGLEEVLFGCYFGPFVWTKIIESLVFFYFEMFTKVYHIEKIKMFFNPFFKHGPFL